MNHRIVSAVTGFVLALFCGAAILFAAGATPAATALATPRLHDVPHETGGAHAACRDCHARGAGAADLPTTHRSFGAGHCLACHRPAAR
ncbi:MAG TPA: hypothetical protein VFM45_07990 [Anaeromyxobacteraceae bacterium]|nr:hypothetical protein [Anaeromyxobacteraceae bacterium]